MTTATLPKQVQDKLDKLERMEREEVARAKAQETERRKAVASNGTELPSGRMVRITEGGKIGVYPPSNGRRPYALFSLRLDDLNSINENDWTSIVEFGDAHSDLTMTGAEYKALQDAK